jgi:hypothetical protein
MLPVDLENIAAAVSVKVSSVMQYQNEFEAAAASYHFDCRSPRRVPPSKTRRKAKQISKAANRLLRHLAVYDYRNAADGHRTGNSLRLSHLLTAALRMASFERQKKSGV